MDGTVGTHDGQNGQWRSLPALDDTDIWANPWYQRRLLASLRREGFDDFAVSTVERVFREKRSRTFAEFEAHARELASAEAPAAADAVASVIDHWSRHRTYNHSVYYPTSVEDHKARYWPNNPKLLQTHWEKYADIFQADIFTRHDRFITPSTPIVSAGSCFAANISRQLQHWGYNYLIEMGKTKDQFADPRDYQTDSATCGNIYNVISMRQMVERAFLEWQPEPFLVSKRKRVLDPFRAVVDFDNYDQYVERQKEYTQALHRALRKCEVFILTLGMTEAWCFADTGEATSTAPRHADPTLVRYKNITVDETVAELDRIHSLFQKHNPNARIIATVSPVPLNATFKTDEHVVVANSLSKSILRVALDEFAKRHPENVSYFPAYELVTSCTREPWEIDMRHVSNAAVARVMHQFQRMYLVDQSPLEVITVATMADSIPTARNYPLRIAREFVVWPLKRALGIEGRPFRTLLKARKG